MHLYGSQAVLAHLNGYAVNIQEAFVVFDLGASLDLAVIRMRDRTGAAGVPTSCELVATGGAPDLGGPAWDSRVAEIVTQRLVLATGTDPTANATDLLSLLWQAERAKISLSTRDRAFVSVATAMQEIEVTREELEDATADLLCSARSHLEKVIARAHERLGILSAEMNVILCGGGGRIPSVRNMVADTTGRELVIPRDVGTIGSMGAALWAHVSDAEAEPVNAERGGETVASEQSGLQGIEIRGRSSYCVGIELRDESDEKCYREVLARGISYGKQHAVEYTCQMAVDNMQSIQIPLASCARAGSDPEGWRRFGTLKSGPLPEGCGRGDPVIIKLWFDDNGILRGHVYDKARDMSFSASLDRGELGTGRERVERFVFSAFFPARISQGTTGKILAYAHVESAAEEVISQVACSLNLPRDVRIQAGSVSKAVPMRSLVKVAPDIEGLEFDRYEATMSLWEDVQSVEFRFQARPSSTNRVCEGWIRFWLEGMPLADVPVSIWVGETSVPDVYREALTRANAKPYRAVFPSYSHKDAEIVEKMEVYSKAFGDEYLRDVSSLRSGQSWNKEILRFIAQADVFQLFWSKNAASSSFVKQEWRRALSERASRLDPHFLRPVYWAEKPPSIPGELGELHFTRLPL